MIRTRKNGTAIDALTPRALSKGRKSLAQLIEQRARRGWIDFVLHGDVRAKGLAVLLRQPRPPAPHQLRVVAHLGSASHAVVLRSIDHGGVLLGQGVGGALRRPLGHHVEKGAVGVRQDQHPLVAAKVDADAVDRV